MLLFSGTVFTRGETGFAVEQVPWHQEAALPAAGARSGATVMDALLPRRRLDPAGPRHASTRWPATGPRAALASWERRSAELLPTEVPARERWSAARRVADAVLYEGYLLYPYRVGAAKNQLRWQFGVLVAGRAPSRRGVGEPRAR